MWMPIFAILHEDEALIVVNKPAPLPIHPSGRFNRNTLQAILQTVYHPQKPRPAHRLDANTSGIVVFTRTRHFAKFVQPQFERGEVEKIYLARVFGHPVDDAFSCTAKIGDSQQSPARDSSKKPTDSQLGPIFACCGAMRMEPRFLKSAPDRSHEPDSRPPVALGIPDLWRSGLSARPGIGNPPNSCSRRPSHVPSRLEAQATASAHHGSSRL
jgi:hypothetical protein